MYVSVFLGSPPAVVPAPTAATDATAPATTYRLMPER